MLRVTVELWPGGREAGKRMIATADIGRVKNGALADYEVHLEESPHGDVGDMATVREYPRWSTSVWDLVARSIAAALNGGREALPERPVLPEVPVLHYERRAALCTTREIPEPARTFFRRNIANSSRPLIEDDPEPFDCAYAWDWDEFLRGER